MKKILVATDLSARSDRAIARALRLAKEFKSFLKIVHVVDQDLPKSLLDETKKIARKEINYCLQDRTKDIDFDVDVIAGIPHLDILKIANHENSDLIILGMHRHVESGEAIVGKVIDRVIKDSTKPVLIAKDHAEEQYENILVGVDFNIHSQKSLQFSLNLFCDANFYLVHSYNMPFLGTMGNYDQVEAKLKKSCQDDLDKIIADLEEDASGKSSYKIQKKIVKGTNFDVLDLEISKIKPELLVLGTNARSGFAKIVSQNVTENLLIIPPCDLLIIS